MLKLFAGISSHRPTLSSPLLSSLPQLDTRRTLKRLAKENLKPSGRLLGKLAHSNPLTVLRTIVVQVGGHGRMVGLGGCVAALEGAL